MEFLVHGVGLGHRYWSWGGPGSRYNYLEAAISEGHAIFSYNRLGVGLSSTLNGIEEVQFATQVQIAATLVESLKNGWLHQ